MSKSDPQGRRPIRGGEPVSRRPPALDTACPAEPAHLPDDPGTTARHQAQAAAEAAWLSAEGDCGGARDPYGSRHRLIAENAYFKAERRGFAPGRAVDDWLEAEREVEAALGLEG